MADNASLSEALTGQLPFGTSRAQRFCIRYSFTPSHLFKDSHPLISYQVIRARSLPLTSIQRSQLVSRLYPAITFRSLICGSSVLTGGKDGIMLVGEIEQGISV